MGRNKKRVLHKLPRNHEEKGDTVGNLSGAFSLCLYAKRFFSVIVPHKQECPKSYWLNVPDTDLFREVKTGGRIQIGQVGYGRGTPREYGFS